MPHREGPPPLSLPIPSRTAPEAHDFPQSQSNLEQIMEEAATLHSQSLNEDLAQLQVSLEDEPEEFQAILRPIFGCKLGFTVMRFGQGLMVTAVHERGVVASWNEVHPMRSVEERDLIVEINGAAEYLNMIHHLRCSPVLVMKIHRQEPLKSKPLPQRAQFDPRSGKESRSIEVMESNLALRSVTEGAGPHSDEVWRAAAVCAVEHFVQQEVFFLGLYGYKVLTNKMWSPLSMGSLKPTLGINVCQHIEQAGHTWYILECEIMAITDPPETLRWEAPRRLSQLRGELHDRIKFSMEMNEYRAIFDDTPFAHSGGPSGTTARLCNWLRRLIAAINKTEVSPAIAGLTLTFLHAPLPTAEPPGKSK